MADASAAVVARIWWRLLALALVALALAAAFWGGFELGRARAGSVAESALTALQRDRDAAVDELRTVRGALAAAREESVVLERSRQIERETNRSLQDQLKQAQGERLALLQESTYLRRLIRAGAVGGVRVQDLRIVPAGPPRRFRYSFTLTQTAGDNGEVRGTVSLKIEGVQGEDATALDLERLPGASPPRFSMQLEHMQRLSGELELPEGFEAHRLIVAVDPTGDTFPRTFEAFPWLPVAP